MFSNITIGQYIYKESLIHKLNPLVKILCILIIMIASFIFSIFENTILILLLLIVSYLTKISIKKYYKNIYGFKYFIITIFIVSIISKLPFAIIINNIIKIIINLLLTSILLYTTNINEINYGLNKLLRPLKYTKIDSEKISIIITLSIKFIFKTFEEADIVFKSFKNRNIKFNGNILDRIIKIKMFLKTLIYLLIKKADDIGNTLTIKNCNLNNLSVKYDYKITYIDIIVFVNVMLFMLLIGVI